MSGIETTELRVQRLLTASFIKADSVEVTITRNSVVSDGEGGYTRQAVTLAVQTMRLLPLSDGADQRLTADGQMVAPKYMLMGDHDADLERWDTFSLDSDRYEVVFVNENRQYQVKGEVVYRGQ